MLCLLLTGAAVALLTYLAHIIVSVAKWQVKNDGGDEEAGIELTAEHNEGPKNAPENLSTDASVLIPSSDDEKEPSDDEDYSQC